MGASHWKAGFSKFLPYVQLLVLYKTLHKLLTAKLFFYRQVLLIKGMRAGADNSLV